MDHVMGETIEKMISDLDAKFKGFGIAFNLVEYGKWNQTIVINSQNCNILIAPRFYRFLFLGFFYGRVLSIGLKNFESTSALGCVSKAYDYFITWGNEL